MNAEAVWQQSKAMVTRSREVSTETGTPSIRPIAQNHVVVNQSPESGRIFCTSPAITVTPEGNLLVSSGFRAMQGDPIDLEGCYHFQNGRGQTQSRMACIYRSTDKGATWSYMKGLPMFFVRPFVAGESLYVIGTLFDGADAKQNFVGITRSDDDGRTWTAPVPISEKNDWHQAPSNVWFANGCVYLVMEGTDSGKHLPCWPVAALQPVLMRARLDVDLTQSENWTFAECPSYREAVDFREMDWFGVPFYEGDPERSVKVGEGRHFAPPGWLESHVVQIVDPDHQWHDPSGRTFHIWSRAHTGRTNFASVMKVQEQGEQAGNGSMRTTFETVPSGKKVLYVPCPGGQMKFHVLYDESSRLYWLLSTQATDSMKRADRLPESRYGLPDNERRRLVLHFSKNMIDWCFAALVAVGPKEHTSRHYAAMTFDGDDLLIVSRSGSDAAKNAHDGDISSFHRISRFRELIY